MKSGLGFSQLYNYENPNKSDLKTMNTNKGQHEETNQQ